MNRRQFGIATLAAGIGAIYNKGLLETTTCKKVTERNSKPLKNKIALNAFSFNIPLSDGTIDLFGLLEFCAKLGFDGVDLTGYYFPGYPAPPADDYIYSIKRRAFGLGLDVCGTGVRNDFCLPDKKQRKREKELVKNWIIVAEKLGAPAIRIFTGKNVPAGYSREDTLHWLTDDILDCIEFGKNHGVVIEIQNHNDFLKTSGDVIQLFEAIPSEWAGLMLDIGSYRTSDPYREIQETINYAVSWQLKENVFINQLETPVDLEKVKKIIENSDYKGYLPIETLGKGDPAEKVTGFYEKVIKTFNLI